MDEAAASGRSDGDALVRCPPRCRWPSRQTGHALLRVSAEMIKGVARMSPSTITRSLASTRAEPPKRGIGLTRPGTLLKHHQDLRRLAQDGAPLR
jgi:hypothetical protein